MHAKTLNTKDKKRAFLFLLRLERVCLFSDKSVGVSQVINDFFDFAASTIDKILEYLLRCGFIEFDAIKADVNIEPAIYITEKGTKVCSDPPEVSNIQQECLPPTSMSDFRPLVFRQAPVAQYPQPTYIDTYNQAAIMINQVQTGSHSTQNISISDSEEFERLMRLLRSLIEIVSDENITAADRDLLTAEVSSIESEASSSKAPEEKKSAIEKLALSLAKRCETVGLGVLASLIASYIMPQLLTLRL